MLHDGKFYIKLGLPSGNAFPTAPAPAEADIFYREDEDRPYTYDGAAWHGLAQLDVAETISADWLWSTDKKNQFRDAQIYIASLADGFLDLVADTAIRLNGNTLYVDAANNRAGIGIIPLYRFHIWDGVNVNFLVQGVGAVCEVAAINDAGNAYVQMALNANPLVLGGGNVQPDGNKTRDFGLPATAWDDAYADDWHNVADFYFMDERKNRKGKVVPIDDLAIICGMLPLGEFDPRTGLPLLDDNSLPPWVFTRDKKGKKTLYDEDGRPYLSMKMVTSLTWGAIRQLNERIEDLEARLPV